MEAIEGSATTATQAVVVEARSQRVEAGKDIAFGSLAGVVGKFIEYPFDTVKVRLQSQPGGLPFKYNGPVDCFRQSFRQEGFQGLYRGISAPLFGAAVETSSLFFSYRIAQDILQSIIYPSTSSPLPLPVLAACGAISGAFTSLSLTPIELIKCQMQTSSNTPFRRHPPSALSLILSIHRQHGLLGFWHGQLGTLIRETGGSAAWFGTYEGVSLLLRHIQHPTTPPSKPLPLHQQLFAGALAGMAYNFLFYPADTIKSRMQTERAPASQRSSFATVARALWKQHGLRGLYQGCGITVVRSAPSSAFIFAIYEGLRSRFA